MTVTSVEGFDVRELIGSGGYSRVYRARQLGFDRDVAIKVLNVDIESVTQQRAFERECRAMGALSEHPHIVTVLSATSTSVAGDAGERKPCIVMEFYVGGTLGDLVTSRGPLALDRLLSVGVQICSALHAAHGRGVVHRDIKPQNVFLSEYGRPALGDFGISGFEGERTVTGGGGGLTIHYAPPEVLEGATATTASDLYSWAATMYLLATGRRPFPRAAGASMADVARKILLEPAPRLGGAWPVALADLLQQAMAKRPEERPASALEFGRALQAIQAAEGLAVTDLALAGRESMGDAGSPASGRPAGTESGAVAPPWNRRRVRSWLLAGSVTVGAIGGAIVLSAQDNESPPSDRLGSADSGRATDPTDDAYFAVPAAPSGVTIEVSGDDSLMVAWTPTRGAVSYQVERLDEPAERVIEVTEPVAMLVVGVDERPCVSVAAVGRGGQRSQSSTAVCVRD